MNRTRFVTIYGFVQSNIQHVSPASGGFGPRPPRALPLDPAGGLPSLRPLFCPPSKFLATPLRTVILNKDQSTLAIGGIAMTQMLTSSEY